jgi:hypothetical protein
MEEEFNDLSSFRKLLLHKTDNEYFRVCTFNRVSYQLSRLKNSGIKCEIIVSRKEQEILPLEKSRLDDGLTGFAVKSLKC